MCGIMPIYGWIAQDQSALCVYLTVRDVVMFVLFGLVVCFYAIEVSAELNSNLKVVSGYLDRIGFENRHTLMDKSWRIVLVAVYASMWDSILIVCIFVPLGGEFSYILFCVFMVLSELPTGMVLGGIIAICDRVVTFVLQCFVKKYTAAVQSTSGVPMPGIELKDLCLARTP